MAVGDRIKRVRNFRKMTMKELGMAVGFDENSADVRIAQYENNSRKPKDELLKKIAAALDVSCEYLTDAAQSVGVSYRQAQRIMQSLCALGVLQKVDSGFQILDMPRLRALSCQGEATA